MKISSFYTCVPKIMITWCIVPKIWWAIDKQTDTDRWTKKWHIEVGASPKINYFLLTISTIEGWLTLLHSSRTVLQSKSHVLFFKASYVNVNAFPSNVLFS